MTTPSVGRQPTTQQGTAQDSALEPLEQLPTEQRQKPRDRKVAHEDRLQATFSARTRPARPHPLDSSLVLAWRALLKIKYVPEQLIDVTAFPVMFTLMFTYLFGGALAGSTGQYLEFLLPGILVQTVLFTTIYTGMTLNTDISKGIFDRFRSLPIWSPSVLVGALLADTVRYSLASSIVILLGLLLGFRPGGGAVGVLAGVLILLVFAFSLSWLFIALGLKLRTPESVMGVSMFFLFPLTFATNIFVDPLTMPVWLQAVVNVNPITWLVTAVRGLMHGTVLAGQVGLVFFVSAAFVVLFAPLAMYLYRQER